MTGFDRLMERWSRSAARKISRRSVFVWLGTLGAIGVVPLLPVMRASASKATLKHDDPTSCDYWRYCAIDGFLCSCCGGSTSSCPPGTEPSPITWVGTCRNAADGKNYTISYNDCCGKAACGRCLCNRNEGDTPVHQPSSANDINWCLGTQAGIVYHCSTAVVLGVAD
jgi:methylamine dehydrogenase light chain